MDSDFIALKEEHNGAKFRAPSDLEVTPTIIKRGLCIGSCFAQTMQLEAQRISGIEHDYVMYHSNGDLDNSLSRPITDYDYQLISLALRFVVPEDAFMRLDFNDEAACENFFYEAKERLLQWLEGALLYSAQNNILTFVSNFLVPSQNPMGRLLRKKTYSNICYVIKQLNEVIEEEVSKYKNCYVLDFDGIAATFGKKYVQDEIVWLFNHGTILNDWDWDKDQERLEPQPPVSQHFDMMVDKFFQTVWREIEASIRTVRQQDSIKMVLVDLDDTMWRGIIGEDKLNAVPVEGWPMGFAEALMYLKKRGIILGIMSKNDDERIINSWPDIYNNIIRLDDFATRRINWTPKSQNLEEILQEVNLLPKNVLFIDDNPVERNSIKQMYPDMRVLGANPYYFKQILMGAPETQVAVLTNESARRTEMIQSQIQREGSRKRMSREEFLASLNLKVNAFEVKGVDDSKFARSFELLNKTNQFNTTGKRWTIEEITALLKDGGKLFAFETEDKYTKYGLISLALVKGSEILQTVMSCRVIGMEVEKAVLAVLEQEMISTGLSPLKANFVATPANGLCKDLYRSNGYDLQEDTWLKSPENAIKFPVHIELIK